MNKSINITGIILGIALAILGFIKYQGNLDNLKNIYFYIFGIGALILILSVLFYPETESPAKFLGTTGSTELQDKQEERVLTPS